MHDLLVRYRSIHELYQVNDTALFESLVLKGESKLSSFRFSCFVCLDNSVFSNVQKRIFSDLDYSEIVFDIFKQTISKLLILHFKYFSSLGGLTLMFLLYMYKMYIYFYIGFVIVYVCLLCIVVIIYGLRE